MSYTVRARYLGDSNGTWNGKPIEGPMFDIEGIEPPIPKSFGNRIIQRNEIVGSISLEKNEMYEITYEIRPFSEEDILLGTPISIKPLENVNKKDVIPTQKEPAPSVNKTEKIEVVEPISSSLADTIKRVIAGTIREFNIFDNKHDPNGWFVAYSSNNAVSKDLKRCSYWKVNEGEAELIFNYCILNGITQGKDHLKMDVSTSKDKFIWIYYTL